MSKVSEAVAGIKLRSDRPTRVSLEALAQWVVWQFPQPEKNGFRGAVRPPLPGASWMPAIIEADKGRVRLYAHTEADYDSPEAAVAYFAAL